MCEVSVFCSMNQLVERFATVTFFFISKYLPIDLLKLTPFLLG